MRFVKEWYFYCHVIRNYLLQVQTESNRLNLSALFLMHCGVWKVGFGVPLALLPALRSQSNKTPPRDFCVPRSRTTDGNQFSSQVGRGEKNGKVTQANPEGSDHKMDCANK